MDWLGWELVVNKVVDEQALTFADHWVETLLEAIGLADSYSDEPLQWRCELSGEAADLIAMQPGFDASRRFQLAYKNVFSPDGKQRLCFNCYDDGTFRVTHEQVIDRDELQAWVPKCWSDAYPDLHGAEDEARRLFSWFS